MKILVTGGSGLLGKYIKQANPNVITTWFANPCGCDYQMNIGIASQVNYIFDRIKPEVVIHCAGVGDVDYAEKNKGAVAHINYGGTHHVLQAAKRYKSKFVYISSNAVYGGNNPPYGELSTRLPVNNYGDIKRMAEDCVMDYDDYIIVRPFLLYGWHHKNARANWATTLIKKFKNGEPVKMVNDVYWQPTYAGDMAGIILDLIELSPKNEAYNVAAPDRITLFEFAQMVAKEWGFDDTAYIEPVSSDHFKTIAPRPKDTTRS
jgi:dTDP-4-dehydrorhamnose reductase